MANENSNKPSSTPTPMPMPMSAGQLDDGDVTPNFDINYNKTSDVVGQNRHATYKADLLFHFTSFTRWFLDVLGATLQKIKKSATFR